MFWKITMSKNIGNAVCGEHRGGSTQDKGRNHVPDSIRTHFYMTNRHFILNLMNIEDFQLNSIKTLKNIKLLRKLSWAVNPFSTQENPVRTERD